MLGSQFAHAVLSTSIEHIFIPPKLCKGQFNFFSVDKSDFSGDTPEGKNTLYATAMGVFQQKPTKDHETCLFKIKTGESNFNVKSLVGTISCASKQSVVIDVQHELALSVDYARISVCACCSEHLH